MANTFALILTVLTFVTGFVWLLDKFKFGPIRKQAREQAQANVDFELTEEVLSRVKPENILMENARGLFPVIAVVFILRSFIYEPFQIPSGSMMPTLLVGDFILVEKFSYGIKEPIWQNTLIPMSHPDRGDVTVFKYPEDPRVDFIKRVVGLPGDRIVYKDKRLYLIPKCEESTCGNYTPLEMKYLNNNTFKNEGVALQEYVEVLGEVTHNILVNPSKREPISHYYHQDGTYKYEWIVPSGHYFVMGDNRDNSMDSRFWGFVPEKNLVGKAVAIWISFEFTNTEDDFLPSWLPTNVRFNRIGKII